MECVQVTHRESSVGWFRSILLRIPLAPQLLNVYVSSSRKKKTLITVLILIACSGLYFTLATLRGGRKKLSQSSSLKSSHKFQSFRQLKGLRISWSTMGTLFRSNSEGGNNFAAIPAGISALLKILPVNDVYLITKVETDEQEKAIMKLLEETGVLWAGLNPTKILFCSTDEGRAHIARQLGVHLHIDDDFQVLKMLRPFVPQLLNVAPTSESVVHVKDMNIVRTADVAQYLSSFDKIQVD